MSYDAKGQIVEIFDEQQVSEKFRKREFCITIPDGAYSQTVKFQLSQDKCSLLDQFKVGDEVKVAFNLQGKPFTKDGKTMYFTNLGAWKIESAGQQSGASSNTPTSGGSNFTVDPDDQDGLPF